MWWIELVWLECATATTRARIRARLSGAADSSAVRFGAQSTVEYALVGALVVIAAAGALTLLGGELGSVFTSITNTLKTASAGH